MRSIARPLIAVCCGALISACASSTYSEPEETQAAAELHLVASTSGIAASSWVDGYSTEGCEEKDGEGRLATFNLVTKGDKTVRITPGSPFYVLAGAHVEQPVGAEVHKATCSSMLSFVPEAGHTYEITQDFAVRNCPIAIKDAATGAEVATAEKHKPKGLCREKH